MVRWGAHTSQPVFERSWSIPNWAVGWTGCGCGVVRFVAYGQRFSHVGFGFGGMRNDQ